ncbi:Sulfhydryl oxidase [Meloidogyne graminicola]|uniref:Sulfhydryl oxidase n=1 Tax=Meloidogyne graminicola TaxID=189291 RepID=A0A8S9ZYH0_9BILA|nr:Sulfhydryl oxidase [Meloidogyne graminicola]
MDNSVRENTGRPCKACFSWEEMLKFTKRHKDDNSNKDKSELNNENKIQEIKGSWSSRRKQQQILKHRRKDCPLDKDQLGRSTWNLLHTFSVYYSDNPTDKEKKNAQDFLTSFSNIYPCEHCAADFRLDLKENPPILTNRTLFAQWMCEAHNRVNSKLGKSLFDCNKVMERWYDGWSDGSCDP